MYNYQYVCVSGSRDGFTYEEFKEYLDTNFENIYELLSGGARGIDSFAKRYALENDIKFVEKRADWDNHGKAAGHIRNIAMAHSIEKKGSRGCVVAFCYDNSRGTMHMIKYSKSLGLNVIENHKNSIDSFNFND